MRYNRNIKKLKKVARAPCEGSAVRIHDVDRTTLSRHSAHKTDALTTVSKIFELSPVKEGGSNPTGRFEVFWSQI